MSEAEGQLLARHMSAALVRYVRQLRKDGLAPPPGFLDLAEMLATAGQSPSDVDGPGRGPQPSPMPPIAVDYPTAAAVLGVSVRTVSRRVAAGGLPTIGTGRGRRIPTAALAAYVAQEAQ